MPYPYGVFPSASDGACCVIELRPREHSLMQTHEERLLREVLEHDPRVKGVRIEPRSERRYIVVRLWKDVSTESGLNTVWGHLQELFPKPEEASPAIRVARRQSRDVRALRTAPAGLRG